MQWDLESELPPDVGEQLGHYVYLYVDPRIGEPFYVGKGVGNRKARKPESNDLRELLGGARFNGRWFRTFQVIASNCSLMAIY